MTKVNSSSYSVSLIAFALCAGCQNTLEVRVERVVGVSSTRLAPDSRLGRAIEARVRDLNSFIQDCRAADQAMTDFILLFSPERQERVEEVISAYRDFVRGIAEEAGSLRRECRGYFTEEDITGKVADVRATLRTVEDFFERSRHRLLAARQSVGQLYSWRRLIENDAISELDQKERDTALRRVYDLSEVTAAAADARNRPPLGFGGVVSTDVYVINPSDPVYREILGTRSPWAPLGWALARRDVSVQTLSRAKVGVSGDSSIMPVMEHSGQIRVYQVANDPAQLTRNIGLIVSKATAAAAKYASGGLAP